MADPEILTIEQAIIAELQRTTERAGYPVIGIADAESWSGGDVQAMLPTILSETAARVIYVGSKQEPLKVLGGGSAHDAVMQYRIALIVTDLAHGSAGSSAGYSYIEAIIKCFARFALASPLKGFLWVNADELLLVKDGKYVYGFELERRTYS